MKAYMKDRRFICLHCGIVFIPRRSDQKFCSTSCRVASHQMKKRQLTAAVAAGKPDTAVGKLAETGKSGEAKQLLKQAGVSIGTELLSHGIQKAAGVHNHDIIKEINILGRNQVVLDKKLDLILQAFKQINKP